MFSKVAYEGTGEAAHFRGSDGGMQQSGPRKWEEPQEKPGRLAVAAVWLVLQGSWCGSQGSCCFPDLAAGEGRYGVKDDFGLPLGRSAMPVKFRRRGGHISHSPVAVVK